jgi:hypothetical protein
LSKLENLSQEILKELMSEFAAQKRSAVELRDSYVGLSIPELKAKLCGDGRKHDVDFELALEDLTKRELVGTGPMQVGYKNPANSDAFFFATFSKNEYAYLKEKGYRAAQKQPLQRAARASTLNISGSTFHNSPIGLGEQLNQSVSVTANSAPVFADLRTAVLGSALESETQAELMAKIAAMESAQKSGGFVKHYQAFITSAANHMALVGPFLPALASLLHSGSS